MKHPTALTLPQKAHGMWIDATTDTDTWVGCDTCGWEDNGPYGEMRQAWLTHHHDPILDVAQRVSNVTIDENSHYFVDVQYLLFRIRELEAHLEEG